MSVQAPIADRLRGRPDDAPVLRRAAEASARLSALLPVQAPVPRPAASLYQQQFDGEFLDDDHVAAVIEKTVKTQYPGWSPAPAAVAIAKETTPGTPAAFQPFFFGTVQGEWQEAQKPAAYCDGSEVIPADSCAEPAAAWMAGASGPLHPIPPQPLPEGSSTEPHQITPRPWQYPVTWNLPPQSTEANDIA
jgi:hypothetical protein